MQRWLGQAASTVIVIVGVAALVAAQPSAGGGGRGGQGMRQGMGPGGPGGPMAALKLAPEQREKVQAIQQHHREVTQEQAVALRGLQEQLHAALFGDNPEAAVEIAKQIAPIEAQLLPSRVAMQAEIVKLLTPDQKKIAQELNLFGPNGMMSGPGGRGMRGGRGGQEAIKK
jgi:Spy/CpxP family protein refolding chaperone